MESEFYLPTMDRDLNNFFHAKKSGQSRLFSLKEYAL